MGKAKRSSRFDDRLKAAGEHKNLPLLEDQLAEGQRKQSKSTDPQYKRTTIYLRKSLHRQLKAAAAVQEREMSEIIEEMVANYIKFSFHQRSNHLD